MQAEISNRIIEKYREKIYRILPGDHLGTKEEAVEFVNQRGFILFHPAKEIELPTLWYATNGNRPVPNEHNDPGHITWQWKDELLGERQCYYGRLLGQKMSFVSLEMLPYFFRLTDNIEWENDYLLLYQKGEMSYEAKRMYEVLLDEGPMDTLQLRKRVGLWGKENNYRYSKNLNWLQQEMMLVPIGIAEAGHWNYAFIFDILPRYYPDLSDQSLALKLSGARSQILEKYFFSIGAASEREIHKVFRWAPRLIKKTLTNLQETGIIKGEISIEDGALPQWVLAELLI